MGKTDLIGRIYESVGDSEAFAAMLFEVGKFTDSRSVQFNIIDNRGSWPIGIVIGVDPEALSIYEERYAAEDPRLAFAMKHPGKALACHQMVTSQTAFERSPLVNEFLDKYEARFAMGATLTLDSRYSALISLMRSRSDGRYDDDQLNSLAGFLPHIQRALSLHVRLGRLESRLASLDALVDRLSAPVLLVDRSGALLHVNSAGAEELRRADYLALREGRVHPRNARQEGRFADLLAAASSDDRKATASKEGSAIRLLDAEGRSAALLAQALRGQSSRGGLPQADLALFLIRADDEQPISADRLRLLFGLTPAETRLAEQLARGMNLAEIGERLCLSRETCKSQLRSIFGKTRTNRQGELVAVLLSSISVPLA